MCLYVSLQQKYMQRVLALARNDIERVRSWKYKTKNIKVITKGSLQMASPQPKVLPKPSASTNVSDEEIHVIDSRLHFFGQSIDYSLWCTGDNGLVELCGLSQSFFGMNPTPCASTSMDQDTKQSLSVGSQPVPIYTDTDSIFFTISNDTRLMMLPSQEGAVTCPHCLRAQIRPDESVSKWADRVDNAPKYAWFSLKHVLLRRSILNNMHQIRVDFDCVTTFGRRRVSCFSQCFIHPPTEEDDYVFCGRVLFHL